MSRFRDEIQKQKLWYGPGESCLLLLLIRITCSVPKAQASQSLGVCSVTDGICQFQGGLQRRALGVFTSNGTGQEAQLSPRRQGQLAYGGFCGPLGASPASTTGDTRSGTESGLYCVLKANHSIIIPWPRHLVSLPIPKSRVGSGARFGSCPSDYFPASVRLFI